MPRRIIRLLDLGVSPLLLSSGLSLLVSQRLVRKLCKECRKPAQLSPALLQEFQQKGIDTKNMFEATGCERCGGTGYYGRVAICDLLLITEELRTEMAQNGAISEKLKTEGDKKGRSNLKSEALAQGNRGHYHSGRNQKGRRITSMVFWLAVAVGGLFAWVAVQIGFYATWILFFHLLLAAYAAIFLTPVIIANVPAATTTDYGYAMIFLCVAVATLCIAYGICFACLTGHLRVEFPKIFDGIFAGLLGFQAGFLVLSFLTFTFCLTPMGQSDFGKTFGLDAQSQRSNIAFLCWWCDRVHGLVSRPGPQPNSRDEVALLQKVSAPAKADPGTDLEGAEKSAAPPLPPAGQIVRAGGARSGPNCGPGEGKLPADHSGAFPGGPQRGRAARDDSCRRGRPAARPAIAGAATGRAAGDRSQRRPTSTRPWPSRRYRSSKSPTTAPSTNSRPGGASSCNAGCRTAASSGSTTTS